MRVERIGKRGYLFIFEFGDVGTDTANVYVIKGKTQWFVIDTFLGPEAISEIKSVLNTDFTEKPTIVVNTHAHFDHFWGNCAFQDATIVAHILCKQAIASQQQVEFLEKNTRFHKGEVQIIAPNLTFEKRLVFEDEGVELFHSPGHTRDAISCIDHQDQVLLVGDNIGLPIPSIYPGVKLQDYIDTLEYYRSLNLPNLVSSHYNQIEDELIDANLQYLRRLQKNDTAEYDQGEFKFFNDWNKKMLAKSVDEK